MSIDIRCAIAGNVDSGKSSLIGYLTKGVRDNGRGLSRSYILHHPHEKQTGRTSSIALHILGFDTEGKIVNIHPKMEWKDIVNKSKKILTILDTCGHEKYIKTTIRGLSFSRPDFVMILVGGNMGVQKMTIEHLNLCSALQIPFIIVITKIDLCDERKNVLQETINSVRNTLSKGKYKMYEIKEEADNDITLKTFYRPKNKLTPIFKTSTVSEEGIPLLKSFLSKISPRALGIEDPSRRMEETHHNESVSLMIESMYNIKGVGLVVGGELESGTISVGDTLSLGPDDEGKYHPIQVKTIHCKRVLVDKTVSGVYVCLGIRNIDDIKIRKGMVVVSKDNEIALTEFKAKVTILRHHTTIKVGYEPVCHIVSIRQTCKIIAIEGKECLRSGDTAIITLRCLKRPEYIKTGMKMILCSGLTRGVGIII